MLSDSWEISTRKLVLFHFIMLCFVSISFYFLRPRFWGKALLKCILYCSKHSKWTECPTLLVAQSVPPLCVAGFLGGSSVLNTVGRQALRCHFPHGRLNDIHLDVHEGQISLVTALGGEGESFSPKTSPSSLPYLAFTPRTNTRTFVWTAIWINVWVRGPR